MDENVSEWKTLASDPRVRLRAIHEYAANVLGNQARAARWLESPNAAVRGGRCAVIDACASPVGFYEAMAELARISHFEQREARKRSRLVDDGARIEAMRETPLSSASGDPR